MAESIDVTARALLACVCERLAEKQRPVCVCYATVGPPVIGGNCCECQVEIDDPDNPGEQIEVTATGEATIHFERMFDADSSTLERVNRIHPCKRSTVAADFSIVVTRCYPTINERGEMPKSDLVDDKASDMHADLQDVFAALTCGCMSSHLVIQEIAVDAMPESGCMVLAARVTVEVAA